MPRSSSGPGRRPFKAEITGSTPVRGTILFVEKPGQSILFELAGLLYLYQLYFISQFRRNRYDQCRRGPGAHSC